MIKKYTEFLNEAVQLILESDVVYSDKFRNVLKKIDSPIAQKLLSIENTDLPVRSNYFDIVPKKNDQIQFMPDRKAQEILTQKTTSVRFNGGDAGWLKHSPANAEIFSKLGYEPVGERPYRPSQTDTGKVISEVVSTESGKTYCYVQFVNENGEEIGKGVYNKTTLREVDDTMSKLWGRGRQEIGVGRGIRALLLTTGEKFLDKDIEQFVNLYKSTIDKLNDKFSYFEVVSGDAIHHWYHKSNYYVTSGSLGSSCMASAPPEWLEIYTANPDQVQLVIYKSPEDTEKIIGRALLWTLNDGKKYMDRIYTVSDSDVQLFRQFAKENDWYVKYHNSSTTNSQAIAPDGSTTSLNLRVTLSKKNYGNFPYLDTLKYFTPGSGVLNNQDGEYTLEDTGGDYTRCDYCGGSGMVECSDCDGSGRQDCYDCDGNGRVQCDDCDGEGDNECTNCDGSGEVEGSEGEMETCSDCDGKGRIECSSCDGDGRVDCSNCDGDGRVDCESCDGNGEHNCHECN